MIPYAQDTSAWEDWQKDYRLGLILILPPPEVSRQIDSFRAKYDPHSHAICAAHISLSDPLGREMAPAIRDEIQDSLTQIEPFTLHYDRPHASTKHPGVAYPITPQEPIDRLKEALHASSAFPGPAYGRRDIPAHMTIAEFISIEDGLALCERLQDTAPSGSFLCDRLAFVVPDESFYFQKVDTFYLGREHLPT